MSNVKADTLKRSTRRMTSWGKEAMLKYPEMVSTLSSLPDRIAARQYVWAATTVVAYTAPHISVHIHTAPAHRSVPMPAYPV